MRYKSIIIQRFIGILTKEGKKQKAFKIFEYLLNFLKKKQQNRPIILLFQMLDIVKPEFVLLKMGKRRKLIFLPKMLTLENQYKYSINWLIKSVRKKKQNTLKAKLINETENILVKRGDVINEKNKVYQLLLDSRPYLYLIKWM